MRVVLYAMQDLFQYRRYLKQLPVSLQYLQSEP
jgi:hypothetical protein